MSTIRKDCYALETKIDDITKENHYKCSALRDLFCANSSSCSFYQHRDKVDINKIEEDIKSYDSTSKGVKNEKV